MPRRFQALLVLLAAIPTLSTARRIWQAFPDSILTANHATVLQDYIVMWVSGRIALAGQTGLLATTDAFNAQIAALVEPGVDTIYWVYPPTMLLVSAPLAGLAPFASMAAWTVLTIGLLWATLRWTGLPLFARAAIAFSPAVLETVVDGQNGALLAACTIGAVTQAQRRPWLAGLCMSAVVLKPQMAIVAPVVALAMGQWRVLLAAGLWAAGWVALTTLCFGASVWSDYVTSILPAARALHLELDSVPFGTLYLQGLMVTPFAAFRAAGCGIGTAQLLQVGVTLSVLGLLAYHARLARRTGGPPPLVLALAAVPLATPYAMTYDMIGPAVAAALMLQGERASKVTQVAAGLAWMWPGLAIYVAQFWRPGFGALVFAGLAIAVLVEHGWRVSGPGYRAGFTTPAPARS